MAKSPRSFSADFKFKAVLESYVSGDVAETASRYDLHPSVLKDWRKKFRENGEEVFRSPSSKVTPEQKKVAELERIIGRQTVEIELLKKLQKMLS